MDNTQILVSQSESPKIQKLREDLTAWLVSKSWTHDELRKWLKGYTFPALGHDDAPHDWIVRAFPFSNDSFNFERILATRIAEFLNQEKPYREKPTDDKLLYNLLYLCANLDCRQELSESLAEVFDYFESNESERNSFFASKKMYNLNAAFREALISNQTTSKFLPFWKSILEQNQPPFLRGNIFTGFLGILYTFENSKPLVDEIGWALGRMAEYLNQIEDKNRHEKFRQLLARVKEFWSVEKIALNWDEILFFQAMRFNWQDWAAVRLDEMVIPTEDFLAAEKRRYLIWEIYLPLLEELNVGFDIISSKNILYEIFVPREADLFLQKVSLSVEKNRRESSNRSYAGVKAAANEAFKDWVDEFRSNGEPEVADAIQNARFKVLTSNLPIQKQEEATHELVMAASGG